MYSTEGWILRRKELEEMRDQLVKSAPEMCTTQELWFQRRGEIAILNYILALEGAEKEQHDNLHLLRFDDEDEDDGNPLED